MSESATSKSKPGAAPTPANERILVVDSDDNIRDLVVWNLSADYTVSSASTADDALDLDLGGFSLIILDTELRGTVSGYSFISALRDDPAARSVPFIICSALDSEDDVIRGFDAGADDYIVKPFSLREMVARVKSLLRRLRLRAAARAPKPAAVSPTYRFAGITIYADKSRLEIDGRPVTLSPTEFLILKLFVKEPGRFYSRDEIQSFVWGDNARIGPHNRRQHLASAQKARELRRQYRLASRNRLRPRLTRVPAEIGGSDCRYRNFP